MSAAARTETRRRADGVRRRMCSPNWSHGRRRAAAPHRWTAIAIDPPDHEWDEAAGDRPGWHVVRVAAGPRGPTADELVEQLAEPAFALLDAQFLADRGAESEHRGAHRRPHGSRAFEAGREFEREPARLRRTRSDFVKTWAKLAEEAATRE